MRSPPVLGIDLGTTNSVVAVAEDRRVQVLADADGSRLIPSVVSFHPQGDVLVGNTARERRLLDARNTVYSTKRLIGRPWGSPEVRRAQERFAFELSEGPNKGVLVNARGESYTLPEISAFVLREVRRIAEAALGTECTRAVITVPANFNELQRSATKAAGKVAGLEVMRILNEPTAAALAYGYGKGSRERIAIYDLGGGTFDITVLELAGDVFEVVATAGDTFLGGDDIDLLVAEKMADAFLAHHRFDPRQDQQAFERLRAAAEWSKCQLSGEPEVHLRIEELAYGEGGVSLDLTFGLSRGVLEQMVRPLIDRTFEVVDDAMRIAKIAPTQVDNVILVGGSTRMPLVRDRVREYFGREPLANIDPDLVVAQGAALQGFALRDERGSMPPAQAIARVALKKAAPQEARAMARRQEIREENARDRPNQPAFAPEGRKGPSPKRREEAQQAVETSSLDWSDSEDATAARGPSAPPPPPPPPPGRQGPPAVVAMQGQVVLGSVALVPGAGGPPPVPPRSSPPPLRSAPPVPQSRPLPPASAPPPLPGLPLPLPPAAPPWPPPAAAAAAPPVGWAPSPAVDPFAPASDPFGAAAPAPLPALPPAPQRPAPMPSAPPPMDDLPMSGNAPPLLLDVTPLSLGIETVGGYCETVIRRNAAIPVEQTRIFSTATDGQDTVQVRIVQGESRASAENQALGEILLSGLRQAHRGQVKIGVTFLMDANGTLGVRAEDLETGREHQVVIHLVGALPDAEIQRMQERQNRMV